MQSLAPEPRVEPDAGTETGPHGLSSIQQDAVQSIIRHCLDGKDQVKEDRTREERTIYHLLQLIGYLDRTLQSILEECKRLT